MFEVRIFYYSHKLQGLTGQKLCFLSGTAGTGKSYTLSGLKNILSDSIYFIAPTGKAADNLPFLCETIHSAFLLSPSVNLNNFELDNRKTSILKEKFENIKFLVIEEYSMIGCRLFSTIDTILRKIFDKDLVFGGISILLCGDIGQLLPVNDIPIWAKREESDSEITERAKYLFSLFSTNYTLTDVMRQQGESEIEFKRFLSRIRTGCVEMHDYNFIKQKFSSNIESLHLTTNNSKKDEINEKRLYDLNEPVFFFRLFTPSKQ